MSNAADIETTFGGVLDPIDRFSEIVFGLIMALSFTGTVSVATAGAQDIRQLLFAAFGCNIAWGIVDAVMYVITNLIQRGRGLSVARAIASAADAETGRRIVMQSLPEGIARILPVAVVDGIHAAIAASGKTLPQPHITRIDLRGAVSVFALVVASTVPVALPFVIFSDVAIALRASNVTALGLLFLCGFGVGHYGGFGSWRSGLVMSAIGLVLVVITIALGG
jgi:VIT1/CCC1 family predicted Fe2+/Mn2+ transporter